MRFANDFEAFLRDTVNLNQTRIDNLQTRVNAIENFLSTSDLQDRFIDLIPAGSWAHRTIIKPVEKNDTFDADVLLLLEEQPMLDAKDYLADVHAAFNSSATYKNMVGREAKTRCVRVNYSDEFHIDVVPYMERHASKYITNRLEPPATGRFELSNPEAFTQWVDDRQRITNSYFIKVVRLMKYLRDYKNTFSCKSVILKTLLGKGINDAEVIVDPDCYCDLPTALRTIVRKLADDLPTMMPTVMDPGGTGDNFTDRYPDWNYDNFRQCIIRYADKIDAAHTETDRERSIGLWREVFGEDFKIGAVLTKTAEAKLSASHPWSGEKFIDQEPFALPVQRTTAYRVKLEGRVTGLRTGQVYRPNGFRQFTLSKNGNRVPKNRSIRFTTTTNVPAPYEMYWKVRNGGEEAAAANQLRGEIRKDQGQGICVESTSYADYHYVEVYVSKDARVVASDRQGVIVT
jgi:Second Messenger Oligonucleotide or Dinucleotide Synthetase domain/Adenylyl/Guanylyl and SMODS C-terminal sensor domain